MTYDAVLGHADYNLMDVVPEEWVREFVDLGWRGVTNSVVSGHYRLTVYKDTGGLRGSAEDFEESSSLSAEGGLHTSVEEVVAVVRGEVGVPDAPAGACCDVVVSEEGSAVGISKVVDNTVDSE